MAVLILELQSVFVGPARFVQLLEAGPQMSYLLPYFLHLLLVRIRAEQYETDFCSKLPQLVPWRLPAAVQQSGQG